MVYLHEALDENCTQRECDVCIVHLWGEKHQSSDSAGSGHDFVWLGASHASTPLTS